MRPIAVILLSIALAGAQGCGTLPRADALKATDVQVIAWTKGVQAPAFRDPYGVCHVFSRDTESAMQALGEQVKACVEGSVPRMPPEKAAAKSIKIAWNRISADRINEVYDETMRRGPFIATSARRKSAARVTVRGFFMYVGDTCHVVVPDRPDYAGTLGHEFKHCVDGLFHDERGAWIRSERTI